MSTHTINVLLIDDEEDCYQLARAALSDVRGTDYQVDWRDDYDGGLEAIQSEQYDVCIVDYRLGHRSGIDLIRSAVESGCTIPLILMTAAGSREIDLQAMHAGTSDYIDKSHQLNPWMLERAIRYAIERTSAARKIATFHQELRQKNEELSQYVYTVSHDLKSPIMTLLGYVGHLQRDVAAQRYDRVPMCVDRIEAASHRMMRNIDDLLELSRAGRAAEHSQSVNVRHLVDEILRERGELVKAKAVQVNVDNAMPNMRADCQRMRQVFDNLIGNALKYGCDNDAPVIEIGSRVAADEIQYFVKDNGAGIDPAHHQAVFKLFHRFSNQGEGSGVGLAIVKRIAQVYEGRVWVESDLGQGTTFWFAIPNQTPHQGLSPAA